MDRYINKVTKRVDTLKKLNKIKRGDTLVLVASIKGANGEPLVESAANLKAEVRTESGSKVGDFVITELEPGKYQFKITNTASWAPGNVYTDIQYTVGTDKVSSETLIIPVEKDITI